MGEGPGEVIPGVERDSEATPTQLPSFEEKGFIW
jgi:hypothetical protein